MIESDIAVGAGLRITCAKDELVQGLTLVGRAVSSRTAIQILSGILLEANGDELRLAATDMELSLRAAVPARVEGDGAVVLPGRTLVDIARLLPGDEVTVEHRAAESVVHVGSGSASYTLHTYNAEDFPRLQELARIPGDGDEISLGVQENQVLFSTGGVWLTTRRIDGQFPNYRQLLPEAFEHELTISRGELLDVVRRAAVMIQRATPLQLRFADGEVTVVARTHEVGESQESMPVAYSGEPLEIGFNAEFLA